MQLILIFAVILIKNASTIDTSSSCAACGAPSFYFERCKYNYEHARDALSVITLAILKKIADRNHVLDQSKLLAKREAEISTEEPYVYRLTIKGHVRRRSRIVNTNVPEGICNYT